jgi:iron(III) transport system substrate-binding protein
MMPSLVGLVALAWILAAACASPAAPQSAPAPSGAAQQLPTAGAATAAWQTEWDQVLAAAKREGQVTVAGPTGTGAREVLVEPFQKQHGISVDFLGLTGRELTPRVATERAAGQYRWDVFIHGTSTAIKNMIPLGAFDPIEPALILPDVKDPRTWRGGAQEFADSGRLVLVMTPFQRGTIFVNTNLAKPEEFRSYRDLLDPKWKGRIAVDDPRVGGPGEATFEFLYLHPELGPDFIRALARQELFIVRDRGQQVDLVGTGRYPILLGGSDQTVEERVQQGAPIAVVEPPKLREGSDVSPANGVVALFNRAPHPNAAKIYINWLLSKEGQTAFARELGYVSARLDVPHDHVPAWRVPLPGAIKTYTEQGMDGTEQVGPFLQELFGR